MAGILIVDQIQNSSNTLLINSGALAANTVGTSQLGAITNINSGSATALTLQTANTTAVTIDASQNVGIGTTPKTWTTYDRVFQLGSSSSFYTYQQTELNISTNQYYNSSNKYLGTGAAARYQQSAGAHVWYNAASGTADNSISFTERMRVELTGRVAIGTGGAGQGEAAVEIKSLSSDEPQLQLTQSNVTDGWKIASQASDGALAMYRKQSGSTNGPYYSMSLNGDLQLGYQISAKTCAVPQGLSLCSPTNTALQIYMLKNSQVECHIGYKGSTDTNLYIGTSGGQGAAGIGAYGVYQQNVTNSWTSVSDERVKTELQPIENALSKVANVRTVTGRFTYDEENGVTRRLPFLIAQDFLTALPEAVDQQDPEKLGLSYSDTIVLAFAAIKELKALVDTQAADIAALKAKVGI
jgi:hypothetical protein